MFTFEVSASNMARPVAGCLAAVMAGIAACSVAAAAPRAVPAGTSNGCPHNVLPLTAPLIAYAPSIRRAALRFVATTLARKSKGPEQFVGARTLQVGLVSRWLPSGWIKDECGKTVWERSVEVGVYFPAMDLPHNPLGRCNACDRLTLIASRTRSGWSVWGVY
jgi:hypothetical protein